MAGFGQSRTERVRRASGIALVVALSWAATAACASDSGTNESEDTDAGLGGAVGYQGTGGTQSETGGSDVGSGGSDVGSGGSDVGAGGSDFGSGGADFGSGGADFGSGGADLGSGGRSFGSGGAAGAPGGPGTGDCLECHDVAWLEEQGIPPDMYL